MRKIKILIADDCKALAELEKNFIMGSNKFEIVDIATNSKEEIEKIDKIMPDIVLTDIVRNEENVSGFDIVLKCLEENKDVKFILNTASTKDEILWKYKCETMPNNVIGYLKKPFSWDNFIKEIENICVLKLNSINE